MGSLVNNWAAVGVISEILDERAAQDEKFGEQNHPDGTGDVSLKQFAEMARKLCDMHSETGGVTWYHILREEVMEAFAESDPVKLRAELIQVSAVAASWIEAIDRRAA